MQTNNPNSINKTIEEVIRMSLDNLQKTFNTLNTEEFEDWCFLCKTELINNEIHNNKYFLSMQEDYYLNEYRNYITVWDSRVCANSIDELINKATEEYHKMNSKRQEILQEQLKIFRNAEKYDRQLSEMNSFFEATDGQLGYMDEDEGWASLGRD